MVRTKFQHDGLNIGTKRNPYGIDFVASHRLEELARCERKIQ